MGVMTQPLVTGPAVPSQTQPPQPLRVRLAPPGVKPGRLDGAWWPRSRDLAAELPSLIHALDPRWGRVTHLSVNSALWPVVPRKVPATGHVVRVGWFSPELDRHGLLVLSYTVGRWDLLVIPPETGPAAADRLMTAAADPHGILTASALMAAEAALVHPTGVHS
jgi:hypothetical protein